jgi:hypothetical protein
MSPMNNIQNSLGKASVSSQFGENHGRAWVSLRGLEDVGVSTGNSKRKHPQRNHGGEVEGTDTSRDSKGLSDGVSVHILSNSRKGLSHQKRGNGASVLNNLCKNRTQRISSINFEEHGCILTKTTKDISAGISNGLSLF